MNYKTFYEDELIQELETAGRTPDLDLVRVCLDRVDELETALLGLLRIDPWVEYGIEDETDPLAYGDVHAGHLLIAARSQAALPRFDEIFRDPEREHLIEWFGMKLHHYGSVALPFFANLLLDEDVFSYGRITSAIILSHIAYNEPEQTPFVTATLQKLLPPLPEGDTPIIGDDEFDEMWTWAILELSNLGDEESQAQIEALYAADAVETWIIGDYDDYVTRLQNERADLPDPYDIIQTYESLHHRADLEAQREALWARQKQEKARIEEMLDKREQRAAERAAVRGERPSETHEQAAPGEPSMRKMPKVGRNAPCPCGSGKKYKKCHGRLGG
ncbi:hypothetical protein MNBD_CHLOROFLEXI01-1654 [hydrothermal vent metagenome]|uniref:Protein export cytoplasm protein SecA ATPase RNA helicase (TC 3.A.5.1.1) n=1 Tax=hydrothermal vent metagenome TaxID=652676 RepID=A0A3B0VSQ3_9ZZZZ